MLPYKICNLPEYEVADEIRITNNKIHTHKLSFTMYNLAIFVLPVVTCHYPKSESN